MLFNSPLFIFLFFPLTLVLFFIAANLLDSPWRKQLIILASLVFYSHWNVANLPVILLSIAFNYAFSKRIGHILPVSQTAAKRWLTVGLAANIALLFYFKYFAFFMNTVYSLLHLPETQAAVTLPLGISFFTFQQIIYLTDTYKGRTETASLADYTVCVCFFPHLIAGPIIKYRNLLPQLASPLQFKVHPTYLAAGLTLFTLGLAKKLLLADTLAPFADHVFGTAQGGLPLATPSAWVGALAYSLQLYFDFSGYSDMALGLGLCFGIELPVNFNSPYKAINIVDFWRRWHITLSDFLRNYLYIPLGGNRRGRGRHFLNLLLTMFLGGLWHGAGWTFMVWGLMHGLALCVNHWLRGARHTAQAGRASLWGRVATLLFLVLAWVVFRAESMSAALHVWSSMAGFGGGWSTTEALTNIVPVLLAGGLALWAPNSQEIMNGFRSRYELYSPVGLGRLCWRASGSWALLMGCLFFTLIVTMSRASKFLYFEF